MIKEIRGTFATSDIFDFSRTIQSKVAPSCDYDSFAWDKSILKEIFINHINVSNEITPTIFWFIGIILCCYHFLKNELYQFFLKRLRVQLRLTWQSWKLVSSSKFQSYRIGHLILSGKDVIWLWKPSGSSKKIKTWKCLFARLKIAFSVVNCCVLLGGIWVRSLFYGISNTVR